MVNAEASSILAMEPDPSPSKGRKIAAAVLQSGRRKNTGWEENAANFIGYLKNKSRTTFYV